MHKYLLFIVGLLSAGYVSGAPASAKKGKTAVPLTTGEERQKWLSICQDFSQNKKTNISDESTSLFLYIEDEKPIVEEIVEEKPKIKSQPVGLNELLILKGVGNAIHPKGHVQMNGQHVLCIQNARTLRQGDKFTAEYKQKKFSILVKEILKDKFILQLNNYSLTFKY